MLQGQRKMLIISGTVPPDESATAHVIQKLLPFFGKQQYRVDMLTLKKSFAEPFKATVDQMRRFQANQLLFTPKPVRCLRDITFIIKNRLKKHSTSETIPVYKELAVRALVRSMRKLPMDEYDVVVAVCAYYDAAEALLRYRNQYGLRAKTALYQVDPLAENKIYIQNNEVQLQQYERVLYEAMDHIFTTPIIYKAKEKQGWDMSSVTAVEFPLSFETKPLEERQPDNEIHCVYAGYLYGKLRDARFTLDLFSKIDDPRIQLYIVGKGQEKLLLSYQKGPLKGRLHILGEKSSEQCDEILASADVFVNIGNTANNMVPSKLFHYISYGKPILNITACEDCPTVPYMERYPLSLTVADSKPADEETVKVVYDWLCGNCRERIAATQIRQLFEVCTPGYIANQMLLKLNGKD